MYKLAIVGSRYVKQRSHIIQMIDQFIKECGEPSMIVSGGASGVDRIAKEYAIEHDIQYVEFPANWDIYGRGAGPIRNKQIVENSDIVFAFPSQSSKGTLNTMMLAKMMNKKLIVNWI